MEARFPPPLIKGNRVWSNNGYFDHGPMEGPKITIAPKVSGIIANTEKPYYTMDHLLYTICWVNGQVSKHYANGLFCIGRFETLSEFEAAIGFEGEVELTVGPQGGFRGVQLQVKYDGMSQQYQLFKGDQCLWEMVLKPLAMLRNIRVKTIKLAPAKRK